MNVNDFDYVIQQQMGLCQQKLVDKAREYATEDLLHNFRQAAHLRKTSLKDALAGKMVKHTVSIYDMCGSSEPFTMAQWEEKIGDHINYLLLLKAVVVEEAMGAQPEEDTPLDFAVDYDVEALKAP